MKAIDVCFKAFHALNAEYPTEAEHVWMFIQTYIYGINTATDKHFVSVSKLISDLSHMS